MSDPLNTAFYVAPEDENAFRVSLKDSPTKPIPIVKPVVRKPISIKLDNYAPVVRKQVVRKQVVRKEIGKKDDEPFYFEP